MNELGTVRLPGSEGLFIGMHLGMYAGNVD